ncbi:related to S. pombe protein Asp1p [Cephalotrichum gorgonifer]|uniref:Inositol hexakisphosphate and diphosphoinositol-pentakisphosphate kinase n=1 Tax=Cephalotrichum gorgonifer TaxID=2041049 RepID=A0AAE8N5Z7_9PEZI|nr:related to S. pombe protein Asp1p [Cephalotrichum gorgonifer]
MDHSGPSPEEVPVPGNTGDVESPAGLAARSRLGEETPTQPRPQSSLDPRPLPSPSTSGGGNTAELLALPHEELGSGSTPSSDQASPPQQSSSSPHPSTKAHPFTTALLHDTIPESPLTEDAGHPYSDHDPHSSQVDVSETPRMLPNVSQDPTDFSRLPDSAPDMDKRLSTSSFASFASGRGFLPSSAGSANGSDAGVGVGAVLPRSKPTPKPSLKSIQSEASGYTPPVTASSSTVSLHANAQNAQPGGAQSSSSEVRRSAASKQELQRAQPHRSRSRAQRRVSGSHATVSHSPASDRVPSQKGKDEVKPAPYGVIGVCALDSKARSKPSRNILSRLVENGEFDIVVFGDKVILDEEVENWPICDYLISFYSDGFPLDKAIAYVKARRPFCVNDVPMQTILWDRRLCLQLLDKIGVPTPPRILVNRDGGPAVLTPEVAKHVRDISGISLEPVRPATVPCTEKVELIEGGDVLAVDGKFLRKPFVEKPTSGEDHNIVIYFPKSAGGGARKLFRKIGNKSSEFVADLNVPRAITQPGDSFVYEKFMPNDNAEDVKAYTVGPSYCHAETRKSPVVDGVVRRNTHGKEIRYVTPLNPAEREIASKISLAFGQRVCGFDLLRAGGKSYVIDVNGWSFVKDNDDYYNRSASILREIFFKERLRRIHAAHPTPSPTPSDVLDPSPRTSTYTKDKDHARPIGSAGTASGSKKSLDIRGTEPGPSNVPSQKSELGSARMGQSSAASSACHSQESGAIGTVSAAPSIMSTTTSVLAEVEAAHEEQHQAPPPPKHSWKLKGIVSVIRHADRTPKQKYKFTFHTDPFIQLLKGHQEEVLLIGEPALASVKNAVDIAEAQGLEDASKLKALRLILAKKSGLAGTKVQIKPMFRRQASEETPAHGDNPAIQEDELTEDHPSDAGVDSEGRPRHSSKRQDSLSGVTMSRITAAEHSLVLDKLQLIVKWGGEPTHAARYQSQELGENMRNDFKLLNREILDDVHVFSSSERRVTTSAQIWASSFLKKKDLSEDFVTVRKHLLDDSNAAKDVMDKVKKKLKGLLREGNERPSQFAWPDKTPEPSEVQKRVVQLMKFLRKTIQYNYRRLESGSIQEELAALSISNPSSDKVSADTSGPSVSSSSASPPAPPMNNIQPRWCCGEDAVLFKERWEKLFAEFCDGEKVDPSKISELYDTMKFDALHNRQFLEWVFTPSRKLLEEEYGVAKEGTWDLDESGKASEEVSRREKNAPFAGGAEHHSSRKHHSLRNGQGAGAEGTEGQETGGKSVRRIFRRRSFLNGSRQSNGDPEQYFRLYKSNPLVKEQKVDARLEPLRQLYHLAKILFDFICPQEYGISNEEKLEIGLLTSLPLLKEVAQNLEEMQASEDAKSFFYFTKESHIYTLLNCIFEGGIQTKISRSMIPELDYLSQICFELYESETKGGDSAESDEDGEPKFAYSIRITISPGCHVPDPLDVQLDSRHCISCAPRRSLTAHVDWWKVIKTLRAKFNQVKLPKTFVAVNLSDAFMFEDHEHTTDNESDAVVTTTTEEAATAAESSNRDADKPPKEQDGPLTEDQGQAPGNAAPQV